MSICHSHIFFGEVSTQILLTFKLGCLLFCMQVFITYIQNFHPVSGLSLHSFNSVFQRAEFKNFDEAHFINFWLLWIVLLVSYLRNLCLIQGCKNFLLYFLLEVLYIEILHLGLWPTVGKFSFITKVWTCINVFVYRCLFQQNWWKRLFFLHWIAFDPLLNISSLYMWGLISELSILLHWSTCL